MKIEKTITLDLKLTDEDAKEIILALKTTVDVVNDLCSEERFLPTILKELKENLEDALKNV